MKYWQYDCIDQRYQFSCFFKSGFHYKANATITTQTQRDYKVEQSYLTLISLFWLEIGCCRGRIWPYENQASQNKTEFHKIQYKNIKFFYLFSQSFSLSNINPIWTGGRGGQNAPPEGFC